MSQLVKGHIIFDHDGTLVREDCGRFVLFDGMKDLISDLKNLNYEIYVWTARGRSSTLKSLDANNILHLITSISCADDHAMKPHPLGLMNMLVGISKDKIIHIGDSIGDLEGAKNFEIDFIFAAWNEQTQGRYFQSLTKNVAYSLGECKEIIEKKFN